MIGSINCEDWKAVRRSPKSLRIEFDPERLALKMLQPAMSQEATPVLADPRSDRQLTQVVPGFLTFNPFELQCFFFGALMEAHTTSGRVVHDGYRSTTLRHRDLQAEPRNHSFGISHGNSVSRRRRVHEPSSEPAPRCMGETHLVDPNQPDLPIARVHSQDIGSWLSLAYELRSGKRAAYMLCTIVCVHVRQDQGSNPNVYGKTRFTQHERPDERSAQGVEDGFGRCGSTLCW